MDHGVSTLVNYFTDYESDLANPTEHIQTLDNAPTQVPQNIPGNAISENTTYLSFARYSFLALSDTSIRIYFSTENNIPISAYNVSLSYSCESTMAYKTGGNNYGYFVEIYGIESTNISELFTVTLTSKIDGKQTTITYSALHYLSKVYNETENENLKAMCLAIYHYNAYAKAYFYGGNPWEIM